jgi:hypothetical protein
MRLQAKSGGRGILGQEGTSHTLSLKVSHADKGIPQRGLEVYWTLLEMESIQTSISRTRHSNCRICRLSRVRVDILEQTKARTRRGTFRRASLSKCPQRALENDVTRLNAGTRSTGTAFRTPENLWALVTPATSCTYLRLVLEFALYISQAN